MVAEFAKYRLQIAKMGPAAFLGHLEFANVIRRALRRAGLPLHYSEGFHPHVVMSFGKALPVGVESECEFCDVDLDEKIPSYEVEKRLENVFPDGIGIVAAGKIERGCGSIERSVACTIYKIDGLSKLKGREYIFDSISSFNKAESVSYERRRGEKAANVDLKEFISELVVDGNDVVGLTLNEREPMVRVTEASQDIFDITLEEIRKLLIKKVAVKFRSMI